MKFLNNKSIVLGLIVVTIISVSFSSFFNYKAYNDYIISKNDIQKINFITNTQNLISDINQERVYSALYMGTKDIDILYKLKNYRNKTDKHISIMINSSSSIKDLEVIQQNLKDVRTMVDTLNEDIVDIFYKIYHSKIIVPLNKNIEKISMNNKLEIPLNTIKEIVYLKENISLENAGIIYILNSLSPLKKDSLEIWNKIVFYDQLPNFNKIKNSSLREQLNSLISQENYLVISQKERVSILENVIDGKYKLLSEDWYKSVIIKSKKLNKAQLVLINYSKIKINNNIDLLKNNLLKISSISLLLLIFLLVNIIIYNNVKRDSKLFEETLKEIERLLNKDQQYELKELIENRDINAIYAFLIHTIKDANESKDLFLANMSHEIRTPLNGIVGFTQLLKDANLNEEEEYIAIIEHSSENLLNIVNSILDLSKIKANKIEIEEIEFDPVFEFENNIESYVTKAEDKGINLNTFIDPDLPSKIIGDPTKISQVIINLMSNAIKFTDRNGFVSVSIKKLKETDKKVFLNFAVKDNGIGISEKQKELIFDEFSQADISTSRKFGGTGLGLAISKNLIDLMGGNLTLESQELKGSTFSFSLSFDKTSNSGKRVYSNLENKHISFFGKEDEELINNISSYLLPMNVVLDNENESDVTLINYDKDTIKEDLKSSGKKILFISKDIRDEVSSFVNDIDIILYRPINLTKIKNALSDTFSIDKNKIDIVERKNLHIFKDLKILVAEDNVINQKLIKSLLNNFGIKPDIAENGEIALNLRKENSYDLIFMDIQMPVMGGIDATKAILEYEANNNLEHSYIVALTANALQGDREKYLDVGMDDYLSKPLEIEKLNDVLFKYFPNNLNESTSIIEKETFLPPVIKEEKIIKKDSEDVLIFHPLLINARVLNSIFKNFNLNCDIVIDENKMLDLLETKNYKYVIFEATPFLNVSCLISGIIRDAGAEPLAIIYNKSDDIDFCCNIIDSNVTRDILIKELNL